MRFHKTAEYTRTGVAETICQIWFIYRGRGSDTTDRRKQEEIKVIATSSKITAAPIQTVRLSRSGQAPGSDQGPHLRLCTSWSFFSTGTRGSRFKLATTSSSPLWYSKQTTAARSHASSRPLGMEFMVCRQISGG